MFSVLGMLKYFFDDLDIYIICKNDKLKLYLFTKDKENMFSEPFIYSGILNQPKLLMKI